MKTQFTQFCKKKYSSNGAKENIISYFIILLLFISCEPEEMPVEGFIEQYGLNYMQIELGEDYCYQKYYNLTNNTVVHENLMTEWDLAFSNESNAIPRGVFRMIDV